jgi:hypothetical protein
MNLAAVLHGAVTSALPLPTTYRRRIAAFRCIFAVPHQNPGAVILAGAGQPAPKLASSSGSVRNVKNSSTDVTPT